MRSAVVCNVSPMRLIAAAVVLFLAVPAAADETRFAGVVERVRDLPRLHALMIAQDGETVVSHAAKGRSVDGTANIKSVAKSIISALVGMAIDRGLIKSADQPLAELMPLPAGADPRLKSVTVGNFLSMQTGLERTSGRNYGPWVRSRDWVSFALTRPFIGEPGGAMLYSTGSSHVMSALLTRVSGKSTWALANEWLAEPLGISIPKWQTDPKGIYFGGNNMALSPRALLAIGELYRNGGLHEGRRVLSESWIKQSWEPRTASRFTGHPYGYGWFMRRICGHTAYYGRGFGGQFLYVIPSLEASVVILSDPDRHSRQEGYWWAMSELMEDHVVPALMRAASAETACRG